MLSSFFIRAFDAVIIVILNSLPGSSTICVMSESDLLIALSAGHVLDFLLPFCMPPVFAVERGTPCGKAGTEIMETGTPLLLLGR